MVRKLVLGGGVVCLAWAASAERLVVREGYDQPASWAARPFRGRDFFPLLSDVYWAQVGATNAPPDCSVYRECGLRVVGSLPPGVNDLVPASGADGYARLLSEDARRKTPYRLWDFFAARGGAETADRLYGIDWADRPFLLNLRGERPAFRLNARYPLADRDDFARFKAAHPNYMGNYAMMEFDSDSSYYFIGFGKTADGAALTRLQQAYPCTFWDYACNTDIFDVWLEEAYRRSREFYFGDDRHWGFSSGVPGLVPLYARAGFKGVCYEATTQGARASWRFAAAFLRGAARQFGISYGWYTANFYDGYRRGAAPDARPTAGENAFGPVKGYPFFGLNRGASFDLIDRQNAYGWLIGARYVEPENWYHYHMQPVERDGLREHVPSRAAKDFQALYDLSKREDRGVAYAPLALLMPIHERVLNTGDVDLFRGFRQAAPLLTLVPACPIDDFRRQGIEGGFYNSEFGEMFDVVCPDATSDVAATLAALRPYKAAALFGRFRLKNLAPAAFTRYAEEGGTLFVSEDYVGEGIVEAKAAGVTFPGKKVFGSGDWLVDDRGHRLPLKAPYVWKAGEPTTARVLWTDEKGVPVAYENRVGKGKVITIAATGMLPDGWNYAWGIPDPQRHTAEFGKIYRGEATFEVMRAVFRRVQEETMPFAVAGDIHFGVNRTKRGWLVWLFNNKGVTNYLDEAPVIDAACDATVAVSARVPFKTVREIRFGASVRTDGEAFSVTVPAGSWRAYAVE